MKPLTLVLVLLTAAPVLAQTPVNPKTIAFDHDAEDYAITTGYELGYFSSDTAPAPVQVAAVAKPGTCSPCQTPLASRPSTLGNWWVAVRAVGQGGTSAWSATRAPFVRALSAPAIRALLP
jgi:hypothetical protein